MLEAIGAGVPVVTTNLCGGATEVCEIYDEGYICWEGKDTFHPVSNYREEWNELSKETEIGILGIMDYVRQREYGFGKLPEELDIKNVARKYIEFMEKVCGRR